MSAILIPEFGEADVLQMADIPTLHPGTNELLVNVDAAGVN